jgi:hypothetical protein
MAPPTTLTETYRKGGRLLDALCRTLVLDDFGDRWDPPTSLIKEMEGRMVLSELLACTGKNLYKLTDTGNMDRYLTSVLWYCHGRSLIVTENGLIGLAPTATRPGDLICVLLGCASPLLLRPAGAENAQYQVVGECYVDGIMKAEAFLGPLAENYKFVSKFAQDQGYYRSAFLDRHASEVQFEDPRYERLLGKGFEERIHLDDGQDKRSRNRALILEVLKARGIEPKWFELI